MSDDEEILYKGKSLGLYNYLTDLGYEDFETFEPENLAKVEKFQISNDYYVHEHKKGVNRTASSPTIHEITDHNYRKLVTILSSQLLFKEDVHLIESLLHNKHVCSQRPNYVIQSSIFLTGVLSSVLMLRTKINLGLIQYVLPAGFTVVFSCYTGWQFYKQFDENRKDYILMTHINKLKKLCFNVLKLSQFIRETEILSTSQIPVDEIRSALYVSSSMHKNTDTVDSHQWKTLPHLRKCLSDTVEEVLNMLIITVNSLKQSLFDRDLVENHFRSLNRDHLKPCHHSEKGCGSISLADLKELTSKYLSVQSEYLKELATIFSCTFFKDTTHNQNFNRDKVFKMFMNLDKKLIDISFTLMMQYNIHSISSTSKNISCKPSTSNHMREINELQSSVHNIFLLLYSTLLRVRNLEDTLEHFREIGENSAMKDKLNSDITEQLTILKGDLISTVNCYDVLCQQVTSEKKDKPTKQDTDNESMLIQQKIKETGIVVGTSDYTFTLPDEVFLSLSGIINEDTSISQCVDDWCLESKPQIPKSLLTELSQTLKSRKTDFVQREKHALERKGLQNIDNSSPSSDEDSDESEDSVVRKQDIISMKYKRHIAAQDCLHSSDSDDEMDPFESGAFLTKLKLSRPKKYHSEPYSDSDSSVLDAQSNKTTSCENEFSFKPSLSTPSVANLTALRSQMWGKNKEEHFSDGSDS